MKRFMLVLFALVLSLCAAQMMLAQKGSRDIRPNICQECDPDPTPTPTPTPCENPIDDATFFVQQQYRDFLYRDPQGYELAADVAALNSCRPYACYDTERVLMSRSMWDRSEFRQQSRTFGLSITSGNQIYNTYDFVELSYLIYLQRASSAPPDDYHRYGFWFWKGSLDSCLSGAANSTEASQCYNNIVRAFLVSTEYRSRFGCP